MMNILKKTITGILAAAMMTASTAVFADFKDMPEDDTRIALENAVKNGLLTGYETGEIKPYENITRAQMAAIIVRAMGATAEADISNFEDMNESQWYYDEMSKAVAMEAFQGDGKNLNPEANITFQEAFAVIARVFYLQSSKDINDFLVGRKMDGLENYTEPTLDGFEDAEAVAEWAVPTTIAIVEGGYWNPEDKMLRPTEYINRVEFATLMDNLIKVYVDEPGEYTEFEEGNVLIRTGDVTVNNIVGENTDIYIGDGVGKNIVVGNDVNVKRLIQRGGETKIGGTYEIINLIGHECVMDLSPKPDVKYTVFGKYSDSRFLLGDIDIK